MKKTIFYALGAIAFIPFAILLGAGLLGAAIANGFMKLHRWSHAELYVDLHDWESRL
jgi:hypothetical protein